MIEDHFSGFPMEFFLEKHFSKILYIDRLAYRDIYMYKQPNESNH